MSKKEDTAQQSSTAALNDDEPDECRDVTGTREFSARDAQQDLTASKLDENARLTDCYFERKDWRACKKEMEIFRACWKRHNNDERTSTRDT
ncbi:hypothetical protein F5Y19DRAFT_473553 [Xylariaceae sp. FL1651]|nr:hypothetical protein F5Y19DRAFT_473553 [Xylariaceae sp. FL1651]